jgi:hypothetical protein
MEEENMNWKYRKRVRILPGFYLNLSKTGMSATIGMKGCRANFGQNGAFLNIGIPGTGIYDRIKLGNNLSGGLVPQGTVNSIHQQQIVNEVVEIKSFQPELITSDGMYGLKESIVKAQEIKKELNAEKEDAISKKNLSFFIVILTYFFVFGIFTKHFREKYKENKLNAEEAAKAYDNFKLDVDFNMDQAILDDYIALANNFTKLTKINKIWDVTSATSIDRVKERSSASKTITRTPVCFLSGSLDYINAKCEAFKFRNANGGDLFIYPGFIVMPSEQSNDFAIIDFRDIILEHHEQRFVEEGSLPTDARVVDHTWKYVNKNGSPDRRYNYNPKIPITLYYELVLRSAKGLYESYEFSNADIAKDFCTTLEQYQKSLMKMKWDKDESNV